MTEPVGSVYAAQPNPGAGQTFWGLDLPKLDLAACFFTLFVVSGSQSTCLGTGVASCGSSPGTGKLAISITAFDRLKELLCCAKKA